jgi:hypothetical protein
MNHQTKRITQQQLLHTLFSKDYNYLYQTKKTLDVLFSFIENEDRKELHNPPRILSTNEVVSVKPLKIIVPVLQATSRFYDEMATNPELADKIIKSLPSISHGNFFELKRCLMHAHRGRTPLANRKAKPISAIDRSYIHLRTQQHDVFLGNHMLEHKSVDEIFKSLEDMSQMMKKSYAQVAHEFLREIEPIRFLIGNIATECSKLK